LLEKELGVTVVVPTDLDTDRFGTFSGERERDLSPLDTARAKAVAAMDSSGLDLAMASEGSFGPHPVIGLVPSNEEWLIMIDRKNDLEIVVREISIATNFSSMLCSSLEEVLDFAAKAGFPEHGLIIRSSERDLDTLKKGIRGHEELKIQASSLLVKYSQVFAETDMRAMMNPSRMKVIEETGKKLIEKIKSCCPTCSTPGFDIQRVEAGLPCSHCQLPTRSTQALILICARCGYEEKRHHPAGKKTEDPMYCDHCNP